VDIVEVYKTCADSEKVVNFVAPFYFLEIFQGLLSDDKLNIEKAQDRCIRVDKISKVQNRSVC